jgi:two-component system OmpR family sensor kinase
VTRFPVRIRLTLAFAVAMAIVLTATGLFLYVRTGSALDRTINQGLQARSADLSALAQQADTALRETRVLRGPDTGFAQVVDDRGRIVDATAGLTRQPLLSGAQLAQARRHSIFVARTLNDEHVRLLAMPVAADGKHLVTVVGASLEQRADTLTDLKRQLLVGGPFALLLASLAGYLLAAAALRPVERMSERAATISAASAGRRLPVSAADDEISRLGRRLNEMLARLEAALERERMLVSNASHELRTPLALIKAEIELALDEPESAPALAAALRSAGEETDRLSQLADDLLLLARVDSGALPLRRSRVSVRDLLGTIATRFQRRATDAGRQIEVSASADLVVLADRRRLEQALANLVENALRHGAGTISLRGDVEGGLLQLAVIDEGAGFPSDFTARAFERFSRADGSKAGAGLGLAIVAAIAQAHGGTASASNAPAAVTLSLPAGRITQDLTPTESLAA